MFEKKKKKKKEISKHEGTTEGICNLQFIVPEPPRFTMQYRDLCGWNRSREMDSPECTLSFVHFLRVGTIHDSVNTPENEFTTRTDRDQFPIKSSF